MSESNCSVENCEKKVIARGYCRRHYQAALRRGDYDEPKYEMSRLSSTTEYRTWSRMKGRCNNPNNNRYKHYGGRGIKVCVEWECSFLQFYKDMGSKPSDDLSIDRINNDGNYEPNNCRWATIGEQNSNKRMQKTNSRNALRICGVTWNKGRDNYSINFKNKFLGRHKDFFEACCIRKSEETRDNKYVT